MIRVAASRFAGTKWERLVSSGGARVAAQSCQAINELFAAAESWCGA